MLSDCRPLAHRIPVRASPRYPAIPSNLPQICKSGNRNLTSLYQGCHCRLLPSFPRAQVPRHLQLAPARIHPHHRCWSVRVRDKRCWCDRGSASYLDSIECCCGSFFSDIMSFYFLFFSAYQFGSGLSRRSVPPLYMSLIIFLLSQPEFIDRCRIPAARGCF